MSKPFQASLAPDKLWQDGSRAADRGPSPELARLENVVAAPHIGVSPLPKGEVPPGAANLEDWTRRV